MSSTDIVIAWVDGNDPDWIRRRDETRRRMNLPLHNRDDGVRFRDWGSLPYLFRGIEKNMPWVHHVFLVTADQCPAWLNTDCPDLTLVRHSDYIPSAYLPAFSANPIELNFHRIQGLSEQFIYFNDDTFVLNPTVPEDFFQNGKPCDIAAISPQPIHRDDIRNIEINNLKVLNDHFTVEDIRRHRNLWIRPFTYGSLAWRTLLFMRFSTIIGLFESHLPTSHLKSNYETIWKEEPEILDATCRHPFRSREDVNQWLMKNWMLLEGRFVPRKASFGLLTDTGDISIKIHFIMIIMKGFIEVGQVIAAQIFFCHKVHDILIGNDPASRFCSELTDPLFQSFIPSCHSIIPP